MKYRVIDNFLPEETFDFLKSEILDNPFFPLYYQQGVSSKDDEDFLYNFQFCHVLCQFPDKSEYYDILEPVLNLIQPSAISRIKVNLQTKTEEIVKYPYHIDYSNYYGKSAVLYLNTNNGYTFFKDIDIKIESIENRFVVFDSDLLHSGTSCTDEKYRALINFNYVPYIGNEFLEKSYPNEQF